MQIIPQIPRNENLEIGILMCPWQNGLYHNVNTSTLQHSPTAHNRYDNNNNNYDVAPHYRKTKYIWPNFNGKIKPEHTLDNGTHWQHVFDGIRFWFRLNSVWVKLILRFVHWNLAFNSTRLQLRSMNFFFSCQYQPIGKQCTCVYYWIFMHAIAFACTIALNVVCVFGYSLSHRHAENCYFFFSSLNSVRSVLSIDVFGAANAHRWNLNRHKNTMISLILIERIRKIFTIFFFFFFFLFVFLFGST